MPLLKIASFNAEWMVNLFKPRKGEFWPKEPKSRGLGRKPKDVLGADRCKHAVCF